MAIGFFGLRNTFELEDWNKIFEQNDINVIELFVDRIQSAINENRKQIHVT